MDILVNWHKRKSTLPFSLHQNDLVVQQQQQYMFLFDKFNFICSCHFLLCRWCHVQQADL